MLITGCATPPTAEQIEAKKKKDQAFGQMLGLALLASSMPESNDNTPVSFYETTVTPEDAKLIEKIKANYEEIQKWDETISDLSAYQTIESVDLRRDENSLYCSILRSDQTRVILRIDPDLSVTYSTLPNEFYKSVSKSLTLQREIEPEYTFWDAFFDSLPNALSHL